MLETLTTKFNKITTEVFAKSQSSQSKRQNFAKLNAAVDEMEKRLDELEASIKAGAESDAAEGGN